MAALLIRQQTQGWLPLCAKRSHYANRASITVNGLAILNEEPDLASYYLAGSSAVPEALFLPPTTIMMSSNPCVASCTWRSRGRRSPARLKLESVMVPFNSPTVWGLAI